MKKAFQFSVFSIALLGAFSACKKDADHNSGNNNIPAVITVDSIQVQIQKVTTPVAPKNPGNYSVWFELSGNKIYYANPSNTALPQFMLEYNIPSNSFSDKTIDGNVCACGYSSKLISDGQNLFYIANDATKYTASANSWSALNYPPTAKDNNGEAGAVYYDNKIYFLGGRTPTTKFKYYDIGNDSWFNVSDYLYSTSAPQLTVVDNKIFALGGEGITTKFSYFTPGGSWTALPDLDFEVPWNYSTHMVTSFQNRYILVLTPGAIQVYDALNKKWKAEPVSLTVNDSNLNIFSDNINVYIVGKTSSNDFSLNKLTLSNLPE